MTERGVEASEEIAGELDTTPETMVVRLRGILEPMEAALAAVAPDERKLAALRPISALREACHELRALVAALDAHLTTRERTKQYGQLVSPSERERLRGEVSDDSGWDPSG